MEWLRGWSQLLFEMLFRKIMARHLQNTLPLPPLNGVTCIVTGCTSGIGLEIVSQFADSGAHVVMAVRNEVAAHGLIKKWQNEWSGIGLLNIEVMELDLLSPESLVKFAKAWNSCSQPLHVLVNNAGSWRWRCSSGGAFSRKIGPSNSFLAELWALRDGLTMCLDLRISSLEVDLDAKVVADLMNSSGSPNAATFSLIADCRFLLTQFRQIKVNHCYRETNSCADALARIGTC